MPEDNAASMEESPAPTFTIRQNDLAGLAAQHRIGDYPVAVRTAREVMGGGFADQTKHPNTWTVYFLVDGQWGAGGKRTRFAPGMVKSRPVREMAAWDGVPILLGP